MINYRFLNYKHYKTFLDELDQISDDSIVFIQDECCIWARGQLYRCGGGSGTATLDSHTLNFVDDHGNLEFTIMQDGNDLVLKDGEGNESRASYVLEGDLHAVAYSGSYNDLKDKPTQYTVDGSLSSTSTNPVQNKVITEALAGKADSSAFSNYVTNEEFTSGLNSKQNKLTAGRGINITSNTISSTLDTEVYKIVTELPSISEADPNKIYLLEARNQDGTYRYIQYRVRNGAWVSFDTVTPGFDLSEYLKSSVAEQTYQHKGDYLTAASLLPYFKTEEAQQIYDRFNQYALQTYVDDTFLRKGDYATNEYVNKTFVTRAEVYNPKQTDMGSDAIVDGGGTSGSGTSGTSNIIVDSTLSLSSANPVQNRIITSELSKKVDKTDMTQYAKLSDVLNKVDQISLAGLATTVEVNQKLAEKQNALTAGNGITIINDVISTNLDTAAFEIVTELPAVNINPSKIYLLEHEENGDYTYTQWRFRDGDWVEVGQVVPQIDLQPYLTKSEAQTTYATKNELVNDYQPKGSYLTTLAAEENYQPKGSYVDSDLFNATVRTIESTYQKTGDYITKQYALNTFVKLIDVYTPDTGESVSGDPSSVTPSGGNSNIIVDYKLDTTSSNPVLNRVIALALSDKVNRADLYNYATISQLGEKADVATLTNYAQKEYVNDAVYTKQDRLTAGRGILIVDNIISTNLDTDVFIITSQLPSANINENKIYLLEVVDPQTGNYSYVEYRYKNGSWRQIGAREVTVNLTDYVTKNLADSLYQPIGTYLKTDVASLTYQPIGDYATNSSLAALQTASENSYLPKGDYALAQDVSDAIATLEQTVSQLYVLKTDVYTPNSGDSTSGDPSGDDQPVNPSGGGVNPSSGSSSSRYKLVTLTTAEYEALVNVNQVEDDTYYFTYEADGGWTFGGRFPITLS